MGLPPQPPREGTPLALPFSLSLKKAGARGLVVSKTRASGVSKTRASGVSKTRASGVSKTRASGTMQVRAAARSRSDNYSPDDTAFDDDTDRTLTHYR
jgi:hypothetical protein